MTSSSLARLLAAGLGAFALSVGLAAAQDAAPATPPAPAAPEPGKPANLCQELVAFVKQPEPAKAAATTPPQQATAVSNPSGKTEGGKPSEAGGTASPAGLSGTATAGGPKSEANRPAEAKAAEAKPADPQTAATVPNAATNPATDPRARANAEAKVPPGPGTPSPGPKPDQATVEKIETAAAANDQATCRAAARSMRVAGVVMPPPLLALSALDLKYFQQ